MPLQQTSGNVTADAYGGGVAAVTNYIEDVFSTYLYTGNGSTQTITNGIDLAGKGGLVWVKDRGANGGYHCLNDTVRGAQKDLFTNTTGAQSTNATGLTAFTSSGFSVGLTSDVNGSGFNLASWTFRKQPKFFDVVTYTGDGVQGRAIAHSLASTPGFMIVKRLNTVGSWSCWHRTFSAGDRILLESTAAKATGSTDYFPQAPDSTNFYIGSGSGINTSGSTYVAYLFAHDAGGFGLTGTDNVISCGSFTTDGSGNATVSLGYEPQWVLFKNTTSAEAWYLIDSMRGLTMGNDALLYPNAADAEFVSKSINPTATGFVTEPGYVQNSKTYIYIAIRRGPMKVPTSGTSVFSPNTTSDDSTAITTNFPVDLFIETSRGVSQKYFVDRLRGSPNNLSSTNTGAESTSGFNATALQSNTGYTPNGFGNGTSVVGYAYRRAPSFFDEVCYTGTGSATTITHNLSAAPELMIVKGRSGTTAWQVYSSALANTEYLVLNTTAAKATGTTRWNSTTPTASVFSIGTASEVNTSTATYVAYLFASCPGVSKVGSYTGTGATQTISCGFTGGARFVLIKRTDSTGDWYVWDTARGMVSGTDPSLLLNSTAAEVNANSIYTTTGGFQIVSTAAGINASGGSYIYFSVA